MEAKPEIIDEIKNTVTVKTEKFMSYGFMCIFVGVMLSVFQQAVGINAVLYYAPPYLMRIWVSTILWFRRWTVIMGIVNISASHLRGGLDSWRSWDANLCSFLAR